MKFKTEVPGQPIELEIRDLDRLKDHIDRENARIDKENEKISNEKDRKPKWRFLSVTPWMRCKGLLERCMLLQFFDPTERCIVFRVSQLLGDADEIDWIEYLNVQPSSEFSGSAIVTAMEHYPDMFVYRKQPTVPLSEPKNPGGPIVTEVPPELSEP